MIRTTMIATLIAFGSFAAAPVLAADAPAAAAPALSTATSTIGDLLANPAAKAIIDKHMPGFSTNPQVDMAKTMTFKQIQSYAPDQMSDATLAKIDADLAKLPAGK